MIRSFKDSKAEALFNGQSVPDYESFQKVAQRKLDQLEAARDINDLRRPSGNHLEALDGDRKGQHSVRINRQFRLCFIWRDGGAEEVEIVDYH